MTGVKVKTVEKLMCSGLERRASDSSSALFHYSVSLGWLPPLSADPGLLVFEPLDTFLWSCFCFLRGAQNGVELGRTWAFPIMPTSFALLVGVLESNQLNSCHSGPIYYFTHLFKVFCLPFPRRGFSAFWMYSPIGRGILCLDSIKCRIHFSPD